MNTVSCRHGDFALLLGDSIVSNSLLWYGEWAENELDLLRRFISSGDVVADIGSFIGTHAIALAHAVGALGHVHAFEPRRETFEVLSHNINSNSAGHVTAHNMGVAERASTIRLKTLDPQTQNLGGLSMVDQGEGYEVAVVTLDMLMLPRLDLVKIDVEGMEAQVIIGARQTLARCRPIVFAECNTVEGAAATLRAIADQGYSAFGAICPAFNENNFNGATDNFYGNSAECAIFMVPKEKVATAPLRDMRPINSLEDVVALLLEKPQYLSEVLPDAPATPALRRQLTDQGNRSRADGRPLHLVAPFFQNEHLVATFMAGLRASIPTLASLDVQVSLYNDSPGHAGLAAALKAALEEGLDGVPMQVIDNPSNLGFIGTCNLAFAAAVAASADVFLLNSDTQLSAGALAEVLAVAGIDPMFGFVSPRSNNATLASLPHASTEADLDPGTAHAHFLAIAPHLPRYSLVPTAVGFAMWIRGSLLTEFGGFDPIFGQGYNEENDLVLRANRAGYRAVLANHAFVWHQGEQSFSRTNLQREQREERNGHILRERYPEYAPLLRRYFNSPEYRAEALLGALVPTSGKRLVAFDFSSFSSGHNGTFESGVKLLGAAVASWSEVDIAVIAGKETWDFHGLERFSGVRRIAPEDRTARTAAVIRMGQPFDTDTLERLFTTAPVVGIFMLDTIAADCGYLSLDFDDSVWRYVFCNASVLFTNSEFTLARIRNRYPLGEHVLPVVSRHSLDASEYRSDEHNGTAGSALATPYILVIGNHYAHKFVAETADAIAAALPAEKIIAVGYPQKRAHAGNITAHRAGGIDAATFASFYRDAQVVVFPSHYEGFGFPVLNSLAWKRPVFVRSSELNDEIASRIRETANLHFYRTTAELAAALQHPPAWASEERSGEHQGWQRSAGEVFAALSLAMEDVRGEQVAAALRGLPNNERSSVERLSRKLATLIDRAMSIRSVRRLALTLNRFRK